MKVIETTIASFESKLDQFFFRKKSLNFHTNEKIIFIKQTVFIYSRGLPTVNVA